MRGSQFNNAASQVPSSFMQGMGSLGRGVRWAIYGVLVVLERPVIIGLTAMGLVLLAMCALVHFTVVNSHFPMGMNLSLGIGCLALTAVYFAFQAWVKPEPR